MKNITIKIIFISLCVFWVIKIVSLLTANDNDFGYATQSFLINYSSGFVRRGLNGEILRRLHLLFGINVLIFIKYFSIFNYLLFVSIIFYNFYKKKLSFYFLILPYVLPYYTLINMINMKDFFLLNLFILAIVTMQKIEKILISALLVNLICVIGILSHETFFFFSIPILSLLFFIKKDKNKIIANTSISFLFFIPSYIALFFSIIKHGNLQMSYTIYNSIQKIIPAEARHIPMSESIISLGDSMQNKMGYVFKDLIWNGFSRGVSYTCFFIVLFYVIQNIDKLTKPLFQKKRLHSINEKVVSFVFLFQILCFLPIFFVAIDWQRWISISLYSALGVFLFYDSKDDFFIKVNELILIKIKTFYNYFLKSTTNTIYIIATFNIIPYIKFGNTEFQFNNIFMIFMNYFTKIICYI